MQRIEPVKPAAKYRKPFRTKRNSTIAAVVIIVVSVVAINLAIKTWSGTREFLVASGPIAAGTKLVDVPTSTVSLNLGEASAHYLTPGAKLNGLVLSQPLAPGDLLLKRDLSPLDPTAQPVRLAVTAKNALPTKLVAGSSVDVWAAVNDGSGQFATPELIAKNVQVFATSTGAALFGEASNKIELSVDASQVKPILSAVLRSDAISVVALGEAE